MKINTKYLVAFISLFILEAFIALFVHDTIIRPFIGDVLVIILIYCFIKTFITNPIKALPFYIFVFATVVEIMQYFNVVQLLNLQNNRLAGIILGTTFDIKDILCYLVGAIILIGLEKCSQSRSLLG